MCEECNKAKDDAVRALINSWRRLNPGADLLARCLEFAAADDRDVGARKYAVDQVMLDTYETQRRDAITIVSVMVEAFKSLKTRILDEAGAAGDKRIASVEWDTERGGWILKAKSAGGVYFERFEPVAFGESPQAAANRIVLGHLEQIGEIHG